MSEWEEILHPLGWSRVKEASPALTGVITSRMNEFGGRTRGNAAASRKAAQSVRTIHDAIDDALRGLEDLPDPDLRAVARSILAERSIEDQRSSGANRITPPDDFSDQAAIRALDEAHNGAALLLRGLRNYCKRLDKESESVGRGKPPNLAARAIADAVAMVYVVGHGDLPGLGRNGDGNGLSGEFGTAVEALLSVLGIRCADALLPAKEAIAGLCGEEWRLAGCLQLHYWMPGDPDPFSVSLQ